MFCYCTEVHKISATLLKRAMHSIIMSNNDLSRCHENCQYLLAFKGELLDRIYTFDTELCYGGMLLVQYVL